MSEGGRLAAPAARAIRTAIALAGGREVCFTCQVDSDGSVISARAVARGDSDSVLALPGFARRGEMLVHNHPSGILQASGPDLDIAARMHDEGVGFAIVDNAAERLYIVVEVPRLAEVHAIDPAETAALLGPDGPVAHHLGRYEDRPSQREMAERIARLYSMGGIGLIEAGTGVGKSLGYLVPALRWAAANGERTIVSTNTITLQEQLVGKDLPFLAEALDQPVRFALLKGWRNYLCLQRLEHARASATSLFDEGGANELDVIGAWADRTTDGSLADLAQPPRPDIWDEVAAEADLCTRLKCPHFDRCFVFKARKQAAQADVIVVNHHLLMADLAVRRASQNWTDAAVLPSYTRLIIDEGHHLEEAASSHLAATASRRGILRLLSRLERKGRGLLPALEMKLGQSNDLLSTASLDLVRVRLYGTATAARRSTERLFDMLDGWMARQSDAQIRLTDRFDDDALWREGLGGALDDMLRELDALGDGLILVRDRIETDEKRAEELASLLGELRGVIRRLENAGDALRGALRPGVEAHERVRWIEVRGGGNADEPAGDATGRERQRHVGVASVPLDLAPILREDLFRRIETCVVTSATLAVGDGFGFIARRLGLDEDDVEPVTAALDSPFDFSTQAVLAIPSDVPMPASGDRAHVTRTAEIAGELIKAARGGVFVLFTSHRDVREAARMFRAMGFDEHGPLLVHGEDSRDSILRRFRAHGDAVLVGTASFWEGVDVPGRALRGLVLARIPFRVPSEPVTAAQCEAIEAAGGDAFTTYMLPHAALRLKQGFGRLIRSTADRGAVVICDPRVVRKGYGAALLSGLPPARRIEGPWATLRPELEAFYRATETPVRG